MSDGVLIFVAMVFVAVFLLSQGMIIPVFGEAAKTRKRLKQRLKEIEAASDQEAIASLLREKYLRELPPWARRLESLPAMESLAKLIEQGGHSMLAHRLIMLALALSAGCAFVGWSATRMVLVATTAAVLGFVAPFLKVLYDRAQRMSALEEQLPDAIDIMKRALRAGHPFNATLRLVAEDMDDPIAREFELAFADINYGNDVRRAMLGLLARVPTVSVMALVTSVLVQKETGGNLAEILEQISAVIRGRFKFYRKVRTLSAEGRLSAWILVLTPLVLFAVISVTTPDYLPVLMDHPAGNKMIGYGFVSGVIGIIWIRKIIRIEV